MILVVLLSNNGYMPLAWSLPSCMLQTLYESSIAFGMRKALQTEQGKGDMEGRIGTLEVETKDFERQVQLSKCIRTKECLRISAQSCGSSSASTL